jgi:hypothetical protein
MAIMLSYFIIIIIHILEDEYFLNNENVSIFLSNHKIISLWISLLAIIVVYCLEKYGLCIIYLASVFTMLSDGDV